MRWPRLALGLVLLCGCDILNPALVGTVGPTAIPGLEPPKGTILIAFLNTTAAAAAARIDIVKKNGSTLRLAIPVQPNNGNPADDTDRVVVMQDCDIESIRLVDILIGLPDGTIQQLSSDRPAFQDGVELSCGKIVVITLTGTPPNFLVTLAVN